MLKSCWECLAGTLVNSNQAQNEEAYGIRLNGDAQRAPPWPSPQRANETMFILPKQLQFGDKVHITGHITTTDKQSLTISLVTDAGGRPDYGNVACQIDVNFNEDRVLLQNITNGVPEIPNDYTIDKASNLFLDPSFDFTFNITYEEGPSIVVDIGPSFLGKVELKHKVDYIRFLTVYGDPHKVTKLDFEFA